MDSPFLGMVQLFVFNFAPMGWVQCCGQSLPVAQNQALYSLIGNTFGGNSQNFQLPDLRGAVPLQLPNFMSYYISTEGLYPTRS
jgi:Microcystin-dependent protein